jgi:hypothetical protein
LPNLLYSSALSTFVETAKKPFEGCQGLPLGHPEYFLFMHQSCRKYGSGGAIE